MQERTFDLEVLDAVTGTPVRLGCLEVCSDGDEADAAPVEPAPRAATTAIVLHGGPGASMDYLRPQMDQLASRGCRLVYYDQRGGGRSLPPPGLPAAGIREHLEDLRAVIASTTEGERRPVLVGYSWGALLALHLALDAPQLIERLLLVSPAPPYAAARALIKERLRIAAARPEAQAFVASLDRSDRRARFAAAVVGYFHDPRRALELSPFVARERAERAVWDSLADYDLRPRVPTLRVPTLICHGTMDPIPIEGARLIAQAASARLVELPACGHAPYIEAQEQFLAVARPFLSGASG